MEFKMKENGYIAEFEYGELHISGDDIYGFRPFQLMVSSIAVCSGGVLRKVLTKMRVPYEDIKLTAQVERNEAEANRIEKIHVHFIIKGENLNQDKIEKAIELTRKNCPMVQSVKDSIEITETYEMISR
ncbi:OsmC family protein [Ammoniphilus sp. CFH 90114]|uniref:OsmC family protein n=1 Tax=Ammoniphilus sp. CFH 90114 TaxID=2493665 RepID=UPI00100E5EC1|nr:OsmC family protein [Ammoniphilus sp. CFH 90114]RXT15288.1 OsmC family peroxiredoxin [Ammoniphilus sp. CFH 90114]